MNYIRKFYKYIIIVTGIIIFMVLSLIMCACSESSIYNKQIIDITTGYDYAIIKLPNGEIVEGTVSSWLDYEDGDQLQIKIKETGKTYLVHMNNAVLIKN